MRYTRGDILRESLGYLDYFISYDKKDQITVITYALDQEGEAGYPWKSKDGVYMIEDTYLYSSLFRKCK